MPSLTFAVLFAVFYLAEPHPDSVVANMNEPGGAMQALKNIVSSLDLFERFILEASKSSEQTLKVIEDGFANLYKDLVLNFRSIVYYPTNKPEWWIATLHHLNRRLLNLTAKSLSVKLKQTDTPSKSGFSFKLRKKKRCSADNYEKLQEMFLHLVDLMTDFSWKIISPYTNGFDKQAYGGLLQSAMDWKIPKPLPLKKYLCYESLKDLHEPENLSATHWKMKYDELLAEIDDLRNARCFRCGITADEIYKDSKRLHENNAFICHFRDEVENLQLSLNDAIQKNEMQSRELEAKDITLAEYQQEIQELNNAKSRLTEEISELVKSRNSEEQSLQLSLNDMTQAIERQRLELDAKDITMAQYHQEIQDLNVEKVLLGQSINELVKSKDSEMQRIQLALNEANRVIEKNAQLLQATDTHGLKIQEPTAAKIEPEEVTSELLFAGGKLSGPQSNILQLIPQIPKTLRVIHSNDDEKDAFYVNEIVFKMNAKYRNGTHGSDLAQSDEAIPNLVEHVYSELFQNLKDDFNALPETTLLTNSESLPIGWQEYDEPNPEQLEGPRMTSGPKEMVVVTLFDVSTNDHSIDEKNIGHLLTEPDYSSNIRESGVFPNTAAIHANDERRLPLEIEIPLLMDQECNEAILLTANKNVIPESKVKEDEETAGDGLSSIGGTDDVLQNEILDKNEDSSKVKSLRILLQNGDASNEQCAMGEESNQESNESSSLNQNQISSRKQSPLVDRPFNILDSEGAVLNSDSVDRSSDADSLEVIPDKVMPNVDDFNRPIQESEAASHDVKKLHEKIQDNGNMSNAPIISIIAVSCIAAIILVFILVSCATKYHIRKKTGKISV